MDAIVAENLLKKYDDLVAVNNVSFRIHESECFGFLGPNGAGKTTTMKMIQCVSPKTSGTLEVLGLDVSSKAREIKRNLGVAPQEVNLDPDLSVFENLVAYARFFDISKKEAAERAEQSIEFFQLQSKKDTLIDQLSGGMKRRLLLARSMINRPKILILDEPTVGLDPQARHLIWEQLSKLKTQGITIILTTHYMEEASELCDRIVIMDNGMILDEGRPSELIEKHLGGNIIETRDSDAVQKCLKKFSNDTKFEVAGDNVLISTSRPQEIMSTLMTDCGIVSTSVRPATLEDVFLKLTGRMLKE
ncbi:MAG: ABC transporter ATP-binding protein [Thermoplasmata archaeon]|nr:ABC transporter ATP-binding protein [Thermoplasmata archaeon]